MILYKIINHSQKLIALSNQYYTTKSNISIGYKEKIEQEYDQNKRIIKLILHKITEHNGQ